jgi:hypothetical protein
MRAELPAPDGITPHIEINTALLDSVIKGTQIGKGTPIGFQMTGIQLQVFIIQAWSQCVGGADGGMDGDP